MSNGMIHIQLSFSKFAQAFNLTSSDWLKVDFWIHGLVTADTSHSERMLFVGLSLCDVATVTGICIRKSTFNPSAFV